MEFPSGRTIEYEHHSLRHRIARKVDGTYTHRFVCDHLGSVRYAVDVDDQSIAQLLRYDEYGQVIFDSNPRFQPFGFAGGLYDNETGLTRFGVRDYEARTSRWTARDPIGFGGGQPNARGVN